MPQVAIQRWLYQMLVYSIIHNCSVFFSSEKSTLKRDKKNVKFKDVEVYYFDRVQNLSKDNATGSPSNVTEKNVGPN
jgi:hypothetical protein